MGVRLYARPARHPIEGEADVARIDGAAVQGGEESLAAGEAQLLPPVDPPLQVGARLGADLDDAILVALPVQDADGAVVLIHVAGGEGDRLAEAEAARIHEREHGGVADAGAGSA